jgi:putative FmdB family regulatory protein
MPLYEYECEACGKHFELIRKFSDPPVETCLACGGPVRKLLSSPAIQFKGTGWYITDYARKNSTPSGPSESGNGNKPEASASTAESAKDSKPSESSSTTK